MVKHLLAFTMLFLSAVLIYLCHILLHAKTSSARPRWLYTTLVVVSTVVIGTMLMLSAFRIL